MLGNQLRRSLANKQIIITDKQEYIVKYGLGIIPSDFTKIMDSAFRGYNKERLPQKFHNIIQEMVPDKKVKE